MTGFLKGRGIPDEKPRTLWLSESGSKRDLLFLKQGESIRGHEFHYWDCTENGDCCQAVKPDGQRRWDCMEEKGRVFAGFPHISFDSHPDFAARFVKCCRERREDQNAGRDMEM